MNANVKKFFEIYNNDPELRKRVKDAEDAYPGSLEIREDLVKAVLLPFAEELGLPFTVKDLRTYETFLKMMTYRDVELTEEDLKKPDDDTEYWLIDRGWSDDESRYSEDN